MPSKTQTNLRTFGGKIACVQRQQDQIRFGSRRAENIGHHFGTIGVVAVGHAQTGALGFLHYYA